MIRASHTRKKPRPRISSEERREKIIESSMLVFAQKGFHATRSRDLARAAGVSEALLFRHFKDMQEIYKETKSLCMEVEQVAGRLLGGARPSTETLVKAVMILVFEVFMGFGGRGKNEILRRLQTHSLLEDGKFAQAFWLKHLHPWTPLIKKCLNEARKQGDIADKKIPDMSVIWFTHHLPMMVRLTRFNPGVNNYQSTEAELMEELCLFTLRGIGLSHGAIQRHFHPKMLHSWLKWIA